MCGERLLNTYSPTTLTIILLHLFILLHRHVDGRIVALPSDTGLRREGKLILQDEYYGGMSILESDCPTSKTDEPTLIFLNYSSSFFHRSSFYLTCLARYPITLDYDGFTPISGNTISIMANATPTNMDHVCYVISISAYLRDYNSGVIGNYTCSSLNDSSKLESHYFLPGGDSGYRRRYSSYSSSSSFSLPVDPTVYVNQEKDGGVQYTIPCRAGRSTLKSKRAVLKKEQVDTGKVTELTKSLGYNVAFDPYKGFIVKFKKPAYIQPPVETEVPSGSMSTTTERSDANRTSPTQSLLQQVSTLLLDTLIPNGLVPPAGRYVCIDKEKYGVTEVKVVHADFLAFPNKTNLTLEEGQLTLECYGRGDVDIVLMDGFRDVANLTDEKVVMDEYNLRGYPHGKKKTLSSTTSVKVACMNTTTKTPLFVWNFNTAYKCDCFINSTRAEDLGFPRRYHDTPGEPEFGESSNPQPNSEVYDHEMMHYEPYTRREVVCSNSQATNVQADFYRCRNDMECRLVEKACFPGARKQPQSQYCDEAKYTGYNYGVSKETRFHTYGSNGILRCVADDYVSTFKITKTQPDGKLGEKSASVVAPLKVWGPESHVFIGDVMPFSCTGDSSQVTLPFIWGFTLADNTVFNYSVYDFGRYSEYSRQWPPLDNLRTSVPRRSTYLTMPKSDVKYLTCFAPNWNSNKWVNVTIPLNIEDAEIAPDPPICSKKLKKPMLVMFRNSSAGKSMSMSSNGGAARRRLPHRIEEKDTFVFDPVQTISLYCISNYPVQWEKDGEALTHTKDSRSNCNQGKGVISVNHFFKSTITFPVSSPNATGNYTCRPRTSRKPWKSSTYIYAMGGNRTMFVNEGGHHVVKHKWNNKSKDWDEHGKWALVPCRLNTPFITPYLFIDHPEEDHTERINNVHYDPKEGFFLDVTTLEHNKTILLCSDRKDGSFIGAIVTVELEYDKPNVTTNSTSPGPGGSNGTTISQNTTTPIPVIAAPHVSPSQASPGFIVSTIFLSSFGCGCIIIIFILYKRLKAHNIKPSAQELDWTRATNHNHYNDGGDNDRPLSNGHCPKVTTMSEYENEAFAPETIPNLVECIQNNVVISAILAGAKLSSSSENHGHNETGDGNLLIDVSEADRSLSSLTASNEKFGYQKL